MEDAWQMPSGVDSLMMVVLVEDGLLQKQTNSNSDRVMCFIRPPNKSF
jgi:hypothetical protein